MIEHEDIIKGYDPVITRRIISYLTPYRVLTLIALLALALSTVAELYTPVILQRTIDRDILARYAAFTDTPENRQLLEQESTVVDEDSLDDMLLINYQQLSWLDGERRASLIQEDRLDSSEWYLTSRADTPEQEQLIEELGDQARFSQSALALPRDQLSDLSQEQRSILRTEDLENIRYRALIYLLLLLGILVFSFVQVFLMAFIAQRVMEDIRMDLFRHMLNQSMSFLGRTPVGTLVTRITNDVETINEFFTSVATALLKDLALMGGVMVVLFIMDVRLALITLATIPPVLLGMIIYRKKARDSYRRVRLWISRVNAFISEHVSGMAVVQMFVREVRSAGVFHKLNSKLLSANLAEMYVFATFRPLVNLFTSISIGVMIYFGASMVLETNLSLGVLIAFINLINMFYRPVINIAEQFTVLQSAMAGGERIFNMLDDVDRIPDQGTAAVDDTIQGRISFQDVQFSYVENEKVIKDLSFSIEPGEQIAVVGYTGAGKTTIANLLTRLWDIQGGNILLDGRDIREYSLAELRRTVQPVQQDVFIFSGTIAENIAFGSDIPRDHIEAAAKLVQADTFISRLPQGYDTVLTEWGSNLSTGQRQLISFSRVVAHDPRVIILDEATASVDTETEVLIQQGIRRLMKGRTSFIIAHRLSTVRHADRIMVLSGGRLMEMGTHEELLEQQGLYYTLYQLQFQS